MNRIAIKPVGDKNIASSRLRAYIPARELAHRGVKVELFNDSNSANYELVIFQKAYTEQDLVLASKLKEQGSKIVLDQCDNHFVIDPNNQSLVSRTQRLRSMVDMVDAVFASTQEIANLFKTKPTQVCPDFVEQPKLNKLKSLLLRSKNRKLINPKKLNLVWFGNAGSEVPRFGICDLAAKIETLNLFAENSPLRLTVISNSKKKYKQLIENQALFETTYIDWQRNNFEYLIAMHDACIIPIDINPFTICKTNNRLVLALLLGVPVIADEIPSYTEFSQFARLNDWLDNLNRLQQNLGSETARANKANSYIREHLSHERVAQQWINAVKFTLNN